LIPNNRIEMARIKDGGDYERLIDLKLENVTCPSLRGYKHQIRRLSNGAIKHG